MPVPGQPPPAPVIHGPAPPDPPAMIRRDDQGGATIRAVRLQEPLDFDGRLDEAIYEQVPGISDFIQTEPLEGAPATEKTEVWVFFDDEAIYIAGRCWDTQPHRIVATELRRDHGSIWLNQHLAVTFDTFYDRRNAFIFYLNPLGGFFDGLITDERNFNRDWTRYGIPGPRVSRAAGRPNCGFRSRPSATPPRAHRSGASTSAGSSAGRTKSPT